MLKVENVNSKYNVNIENINIKKTLHSLSFLNDEESGTS